MRACRAEVLRAYAFIGVGSQPRQSLAGTGSAHAAPVMPRYATQQRRAPPERCYRFGTPLVDVTHEAVGRRGPVALAATKLTAWLGVQTAGHSRR